MKRVTIRRNDVGHDRVVRLKVITMVENGTVCLRVLVRHFLKANACH